MNLLKQKSFYKTLFAIILPIALQQLLSFSVNMFDSLMLGKLGEVVIASSTIANQPFFIYSIITFGIASGAGVLVSQYWGQRNIQKIKIIYSMMLKIALVISLLAFAVVIIFPEQIISMFLSKTDPNYAEVLEKGGQYLSIVSFSYVVFGITNTTYSMFRSMEKIKVAVFSNLVAIIVNVSLNYVLIFGKLGMPALGIKGAAIATLIARCCELIVLTVYLKFIERDLKFKIKNITLFDRQIFNSYIKFSVPVILNEALWSFGATAQNMIIGKMGSDAVASTSIAGLLFQLSAIFLFGIASASAVMTGKAIGEGKSKKEVLSLASAFQIVALVSGLISALIIIVARKPILSFYDITQSTKDLANTLMLISAFIVVFQSFTITNMMGILRGGGDTKVVLILDVAFLYIIALPLGLLGNYAFHLSVPVVYFLMKSEEILKVLASIVRIFKQNWIKDVTIKDKDLIKLLDSNENITF